MATTCAKCGVKIGLMGMLSSDLGAEEFICQPCQERIREARRVAGDAKRLADEERVKQLKQAAAKVILTTTPKVDGTQVVAYLGIESVEYVIGTGIFSEITTDFADIFGQRSTAFEKKLQVAKQNAMEVLKIRAAEKGANAVIGIDMDYAEFSGNRVALIINGTLVKLAPIASRSTPKQPNPEV